MNSIYGFEGEARKAALVLPHGSISLTKAAAQVRAKFNDTMAKLFAEVFRCLPLGAVLGGKVFVVHGGLFSRDDVTLDELRSLNRFREPPDEGPMCEVRFMARSLHGRDVSRRSRTRQLYRARCSGVTPSRVWDVLQASAASVSRLALT